MSILSPTALRIFSKGSIAFLSSRRRDVEAAVLLRRRIERPDLHGGDPAFQQALRQCVGAVHERVEILVRSLALAEVPVGYGADVLRAHVAIAGAGVVDAELVATQSAQHLVHRLLADLAEDVPQRDVDRRSCAVLRAGGRLRHRQVDHLLVERFDLQRIASDQSSGQRFVDVRLDRAGAIERFAEPDHSAVGVDADPEHVREFFGTRRFRVR